MNNPNLDVKILRLEMTLPTLTLFRLSLGYRIDKGGGMYYMAVLTGNVSENVTTPNILSLHFKSLSRLRTKEGEALGWLIDDRGYRHRSRQDSPKTLEDFSMRGVTFPYGDIVSI